MALLRPEFLRRFRFVISKDFFVSWGISFGFLLGIFSGLAQLLPELKLSLQVSLGLIAGSVLIGIVYAYRKNRAVHLAVESLLPDSPAVGPALSLECSTERGTIVQ